MIEKYFLENEKYVGYFFLLNLEEKLEKLVAQPMFEFARQHIVKKYELVKTIHNNLKNGIYYKNPIAADCDKEIFSTSLFKEEEIDMIQRYIEKAKTEKDFADNAKYFLNNTKFISIPCIDCGLSKIIE